MGILHFPVLAYQFPPTQAVFHSTIPRLPSPVPLACSPVLGQLIGELLTLFRQHLHILRLLLLVEIILIPQLLQLFLQQLHSDGVFRGALSRGGARHAAGGGLSSGGARGGLAGRSFGRTGCDRVLACGGLVRAILGKGDGGDGYSEKMERKLRDE